MVAAEVPVSLIYEEIKLECGYRIDLLVENIVIIELKVVEKLTEVHTAQILTYLKFSGHRVGLLLNFNIKSLREGIKKYIQ